jgi:hypothetical protein
MTLTWEHDYRTGGNCSAHRATTATHEYLITDGEGNAPQYGACTLHIMLAGTCEPIIELECDLIAYAKMNAQQHANGGAA